MARTAHAGPRPPIRQCPRHPLQNGVPNQQKPAVRHQPSPQRPVRSPTLLTACSLPVSLYHRLFVAAIPFPQTQTPTQPTTQHPHAHSSLRYPYSAFPHLFTHPTKSLATRRHLLDQHLLSTSRIISTHAHNCFTVACCSPPIRV